MQFCQKKTNNVKFITKYLINLNFLHDGLRRIEKLVFPIVDSSPLNMEFFILYRSAKIIKFRSNFSSSLQNMHEKNSSATCHPSDAGAGVGWEGVETFCHAIRKRISSSKDIRLVYDPARKAFKASPPSHARFTSNANVMRNFIFIVHFTTP